MDIMTATSAMTEQQQADATGARTSRAIGRASRRTDARAAQRTTTRRGRGTGPAPLPRTACDLLADAGRALGRAIRAQGADEKYAAAHLAALRGAAAVLAARARPHRSARRSAWDLLPRVAPELAEWALFFAAGSARRQAVDAGVPVRIPAREADDMVRQAAAFLDLVDRALGSG